MIKENIMVRKFWYGGCDKVNKINAICSLLHGTVIKPLRNNQQDLEYFLKNWLKGNDTRGLKIFLMLFL